MHDLANPNHTESHFQSSELVRDVVIGMADGLTVPFALAAGLSGAVGSSHIVVLAGLAEIAAGSIAMGLGATWPLAATSNTTSANENEKNEKSLSEHRTKKRKFTKSLKNMESRAQRAHPFWRD